MIKWFPKITLARGHICKLCDPYFYSYGNERKRWCRKGRGCEAAGRTGQGCDCVEKRQCARPQAESGEGSVRPQAEPGERSVRPQAEPGEGSVRPQAEPEEGSERPQSEYEAADRAGQGCDCVEKGGSARP